jgi:mRNA-degrading endonuclease RelE of RelBE toxin-antitoxin system
VSRYTVYVTPAAWKEMKTLPGHMRQRARRAVSALAEDPRPAKSKALDVPGVPCEVRRLRFDRWRVVYAVTEAEQVVDVLAVRKRPPYDYGDLATLLEDGPST